MVNVEEKFEEKYHCHEEISFNQPFCYMWLS